MVRRTLGELGKTTAELPGLQALSSELKATSEKGFIKLAELVRKDPKILEGGSRKPEEVQQLLAKSYTANGRYAELNKSTKRSFQKQHDVAAQIDAAMNYQLWSQDKRCREVVKFALMGNLSDPAKPGKNIIWGWGRYRCG